MRALSWKKGAMPPLAPLKSVSKHHTLYPLCSLFYAHSIPLPITQPQKETFLDLRSTQSETVPPFSMPGTSVNIMT